jgi:hypothetical protein
MAERPLRRCIQAFTSMSKRMGGRTIGTSRAVSFIPVSLNPLHVLTQLYLSVEYMLPNDEVGA